MRISDWSSDVCSSDLLYKASAKDVRMLMIDPKMLELSVYQGIPRLLAPVVTDMKEAANGLRWCVAEMERRYKLMSAVGVRNLAGFNKKVKDAQDSDQPMLDPLFKPNPESDEVAQPLETLPFIVVFIDEFADMMMIVGKKVEELIARLAQKARAACIHLILATQRPSVDVITGLRSEEHTSELQSLMRISYAVFCLKKKKKKENQTNKHINSQ